MITPTASDLLACIEGNLAGKIQPHLTDPIALSTVATIRHILRHVGERVRREGQVLSDDISALRTLLPEVVDHLNSSSFDSSPVVSGILDSLDRKYRERGQYPDLGSLAIEAGALRAALQDAQKLLKSGVDQSIHANIQEKIKTYIIGQLAAEIELVEPAFVDQGPRR